MTKEKNIILFVDDEEPNLIAFKFQFNKYFKVLTASSGTEALEIIRQNSIKVIITDQRMPEMTGVELLETVHKNIDNIPGIILTAYLNIEALTNGINYAQIFGFVHKPYNVIDLKSIIDKAIEVFELKEHNKNLIIELYEKNNELNKNQDSLLNEIDERKKAEEKLKSALQQVEMLKEKLKEENTYLKEEINTTHNISNIISKSENYRNVLKLVEYVSPTNSTVLITGETGTGKELLASAVHQFSNRSENTLVRVNCASLPEHLIESELFGHVKGAFTGAIADKKGRFELANNGTLFLDEIGELPLNLQSKLLRVLQEGEFEKIGSSKTIKINVRIIAATNRNLPQMIVDGLFREDLFYRLNVFPINSIPLRERKEDIPILVIHFLKKFSQRLGKLVNEIDNASMNELLKYNWPGNVRELENVIERSIILSNGNRIQNLPGFSDVSPQKNIQDLKLEKRNIPLKDEERILYALNNSNWKVEGENGAANMLGLAPSTLRSKMKKLEITRPMR